MPQNTESGLLKLHALKLALPKCLKLYAPDCLKLYQCMPQNIVFLLDYLKLYYSIFQSSLSGCLKYKNIELSLAA